MSESLTPGSASGTGCEDGASPLIKDLPSIGDLFKASWRRYTASLNVFAVIYMFYFVPLAIVMAIMSSIYHKAPKPLNPLVLAWLIGGGVMLGLIYAWGQAAFIYAATGRFHETKKLLREALEKTVSFAWIYLILGLSLFAGIVFFIIPAIIVMVWLSFAAYVLAIEGEKGIGAAIKSGQYVRGRWWAVLIRILPVWVLPILLNIVPVIGPLLTMLFIPFAIVYHCALFERLMAIKGSVEAPSAARKKVVAIVGGLLVAIAALVMVPTISNMSLKQMEQIANDPAAVLQQLRTQVLMRAQQGTTQGAGKGATNTGHDPI